jgi:hypothetical protein
MCNKLLVIDLIFTESRIKIALNKRNRLFPENFGLYVKYLFSLASAE